NGLGAGLGLHAHGENRDLEIAANRILFGRDDERGVGVARSLLDGGEIGRRIPVMIAERQLARHVVAERPERVEEALGPRDASERENPVSVAALLRAAQT